MKKLKSKNLIIIIILILAAIILPLIPEALDISLFKSDKAVEINIPEGSSTKDIADILKENGLIKSRTVFLLKVKSSEYSKNLNYGKFILNKKMTVSEIIEFLGKNHYTESTFTVTFPEGSSVQQMGAILEEKGITTKESFLNALNDSYEYEFLENIPEGNYDYRLQGMLFPDTYEFYTTATPHEIIDKMLGEFENKYLSATDSFSNLFEIITKASIIEKEAKLDSERPTVAGVINNRLSSGMALQIDACVVYAVTDGMYDISKVYNSHLKTDSPYNTYKYKGLTPGPICNPGITSIKAALNPESHEYLYYHTDETKNDGSHIFTKTFESHVGTMK